MMKDDAISFVIELAKRTILVPVKDEDINEGYDASVYLASECFAKAAEDVAKSVKRDGIDNREYVKTVLDYAQDLWDAMCDYLESTQNGMVCQKFGLLSTLLIATDTLQTQSLYEHIKALTPQILQERQLTMFKDPIPGYPTISTEEIDEIIDNCDPNLVKEFFEIFKDIKVFHGDASRYENLEDREKHKKMVAIFSKMMGT